MLLIVRLPQPETIAWAERSGLEGLVGPTSSDGWTAMWSEGSPAPDVAAAFLGVDETADALTLRVRTEDGRLHRRSWQSHRGQEPGDPPRQVAAALAALFARADRLPELAELLERDVDAADELVDGLAGVLDLPQLEEPSPGRTAVGLRGDHSLAELAASVAGPAYVSPGVDGWTTLLPAGESEDPSLELTAGLSGASRRRDVVLTLWRDDAACGVQVWRRGRPTASWAWNEAWSTVSADPVADQAEAVRELARVSGGPVEQDFLRALLRRRRPDGDPLGELVNLLGLPAELLDALDRPETFRERSGVRLTERVPLRRAVLAPVREADVAKASGTVRALRWLYALGTAAAAAVCIAMLVLSVAVLVTDGAAVDQPAATWHDWLWLAVFGVLAAILVPTARARLRRMRRRL